MDVHTATPTAYASVIQSFMKARAKSCALCVFINHGLRVPERLRNSQLMFNIN